MCNAFSCLVTRGGKVYWKAGIDSHEALIYMFKGLDNNLSDDKTPPLNTFARIEIVPPRQDYLNTDFKKWKYKIDEKIKPEFLSDEHKGLCRTELDKWAEEIYSKINLEEARNPINPFHMKPPKKITEKHIKLLRQWRNVWNYVEDSVWNSILYETGEDVGRDVWLNGFDETGILDNTLKGIGGVVNEGVWSIWGSVKSSIRAYYGSLFPGIKEWKGVTSKDGSYPFQSAVDLWKQGLVPSYDGKVWRLHGCKDAKILWEGEINHE